MSLDIDVIKNKLTIYIPNSEATVVAQHVGIKDRSVCSYYMSDAFENVKRFLNDFDGEFYIDFYKTCNRMNDLYDDIFANEKADMYKEMLGPQVERVLACEDKYMEDSLVKIPGFTVNENQKYLKFISCDAVNEFTTLLIGDLTKIVITKLSSNTFIIHGDYINEYLEKLNNDFR